MVVKKSFWEAGSQISDPRSQSFPGEASRMADNVDSMTFSGRKTLRS